ncbi:hypothetical protein [Acidaminococcus massiliensis]|uniref:hypothetical protein n=1 Tax=Acidaminococcus massiliensis TaxID=1852375 RepID=UPI00205BB5C2|nr:hypothetical protein [Acidaminococcus massiliensis]DAR24907.1 MAG TPA: hypothetical protein [Caudoviricetes sp.]
MTEFTDGTAKGKTLSLVSAFSQIDKLSNSCDELNKSKTGTILTKVYTVTPTNAVPCGKISANDIAGYKFLFWLCFWSNNTINLVYTDNPTSQKNASIFTNNGSDIVNGTVSALAVYTKV